MRLIDWKREILQKRKNNVCWCLRERERERERDGESERERESQILIVKLDQISKFPGMGLCIYIYMKTERER